MSTVTPASFAPQRPPAPPFALAPLPVPATSLVGRRQEVHQAQELLRQPDVRLVTLVGPGGVGKMRVALSVAAGMEEEFPDGVASPPFGMLRQPDSQGLAIARALGVRESGEQSLADALIETLRTRTILLLLVDREDWWGASPLLSSLLAACPRLKILSARQTPLDLPGERVVNVAPLDTPPAVPSLREDVRAYASVRLFQERAGEPATPFAGEYANTVAQLCQRLGGLPLAIELAAAHVPDISPATVLSQLNKHLPATDHLPPTARLDATRQGALAWSYSRLAPGDQARFRALSVLVSPFTAEAARAIAGGDVETLVAANLARKLPMEGAALRYFLLEPVRAFARQQLDDAGETPATLHRHATHFAGLATGASAAGAMPGDRTRLDALAASYPDLRQALAWLQEHDPDEALYLAGSLFDLWHTTGMYSEGRHWLQRTLAHGSGAAPETRLSALGSAAALALLQGDLLEANTLVARELPLARELGDPYGLLVALINAGLLAYGRSEFAASAAHFQEAYALATSLEAEDPQVRAITGTVLGNLGSLAMAEGHADEAIAAFTASVEALRQARYPWASLGPLLHLGVLQLWQGDADRAAALLSEAIDAASTTRDPRQTASLLLALACLLIDRGQPTLGGQLLGTADRLATSLRVPYDPAERLLRERAASAASASLGERALAAALGVGAEMAADAMLARAQLSIVPPRRPQGPPPISPREAEVLRLAAQGLTDREIAQALFISQRTVSNHVARALGKLGVRTRQEATELAQQMGWLTAEPVAET